MATYSEKLKDPRWQKKRLEILNRDDFTCKLCGDTETELQIHHKYYTKGKDPWEYNNSSLTTYCKHCHETTRIYPDKELLSAFKLSKVDMGLHLTCTVLNDDGLKLSIDYHYNDGRHENHLGISYATFKRMLALFETGEKIIQSQEKPEF